MKGRKGIITAAVAVAAISACIALTAFGKGGGKQYEAAYVTRGNIAGSIEESGNVDGEDEYTYFARVTAPIERLDIKAGDRVTGGDLLLSYDISDYERSVSEAAISREQSEDDVKGKIDKSNEYSSKYNKAASDDNAYAILYAWQRESADSQDESQYTENWNIQCEADSLKKRIAGKNEDIAEKKTEYDKLSAAEKTGDKGKEIQGDIDELNEDIAGLNKGLAGLPPTQMTPDEYARFNDTANLMEDINRNWTQAKTEKKTYEEGILNKSQKEALEKQTDLLRSREEAAQIELAKAAEGVRADCSGVVTECMVKEGSIVTKGTPLFRLVNTDDLKVTLMISKYDIGKIKIGQRAEADVAGKVYDATVSRINHVAVSDDSDKNKVAVEVSINEPDEALILGIEADVTIYTDEEDGVLLVPYSALYTDNEGDYCYAIEDGVIAKKYINAGIRTSEYAEVKEGLSENDVVITDAVTDDQIGEKAVGAVH